MELTAAMHFGYQPVFYDQYESPPYEDVINTVRTEMPIPRAGSRQQRAARELKQPRVRKYKQIDKCLKGDAVTASPPGLLAVHETIEVKQQLIPYRHDIASTDSLDVVIVQQTVSAIDSPPVKRGPGRPRKNPPVPENPNKRKVHRTKTGCITCRARKKKCDEAKPNCENCCRAGKLCEGYNPPTVHMSKKEQQAASWKLPRVELPHVCIGVETGADRVFFDHFNACLSLKFTVEKPDQNSFQHIVLPIALGDLGLMHSLLALASRHLVFDSCYTKGLRQKYGVSVKDLQESSAFHVQRAQNMLVNRQTTEPAPRAEHWKAIILQMLCRVLMTLCDPVNRSGEHRAWLSALGGFSSNLRPEEDRAVLELINEFTAYHVSADRSMRHPHCENIWHNVTSLSGREMSPEPETPRLLGVSDDIFRLMGRISELKNQMRTILLSGRYGGEYFGMFPDIRNDIEQWEAQWPANDLRYSMNLDELHRLMMGVHLFHTVYPFSSTDWTPHPVITHAVNEAIVIIKKVASGSRAQTILLKPIYFIGWAAFYEEQRESIRVAIKAVHTYMEFRNAETALEVLEEVWRRIDQRDPLCWDVPHIALNVMGADFLAT